MIPFTSRRARLQFLSTPSARRATELRNTAADAQAISIHALREEGDLWRGSVHCAGCEISIHALREEGDRCTVSRIISLAISIHALREEGDSGWKKAASSSGHFYPRPPRGGRLRRAACPEPGSLISIHALREEGDCRIRPQTRRPWYFYPRPPRGGRQSKEVHLGRIK